MLAVLHYRTTRSHQNDTDSDERSAASPGNTNRAVTL